MTISGRKPRWRRRALTLILIVLGLLVVALLAVVLYLRFGDLSGYRDTVANLLSDVLGREVRISGEFTPDIGLSSRLVATDLVLTNPSWCSDPAMVTIDRVLIEIDLWSLVSGPLRIIAVEITGAKVSLEDGGEGRVNWYFDAFETDSPESAEPFQIVIEQASVQDLDFAFLSPASSIAVGVGAFGLRSDDAAVLTLDLDGQVEGVPVRLSGTVDNLPGLIAGGPIRHNLSGKIGDVAVSLRGSIGDLGTLAGTDVELDAKGSGLNRITQLFAVEGIDPGAFELGAKVAPSEEGFDIDLNASATDLEIEIAASVDSLLGPARADLTVSAHGPRAATVAALAGIEGLPAEPFEVSGRVRWQGWPITFEAVEAQVGDNTLTIDGILGLPPLMEGTRFEVRGSGPDARAIGALVGLDLPPGEYSVGGRIFREENSLRLEDVEATMGAATIAVTGMVGDPPLYEGTDLSVQARGRYLSTFRALAGIDLPRLPFEVSGRLVPGDGAIALKGVSGRLGANTLRVGGQLSTDKRLAGTRLTVHADGPDSSEVASMFGINGVPPLRYRIDGEVTVQRGGVRVRGLEVALGDISLRGDGFIPTTGVLEGTEARFELAGPDLSFPASFVNSIDLPNLPFRVGGAVRVGDEAYHLTGVTATIDDIEIAVDGLVGVGPGAEGTQATVRVHGPRLATLGAVLQQKGWPATAFQVVSGVRVSSGAVGLDEAVVDLGVVQVEASGTILPVTGLVGSELDLDLRGENLGDLGRLLVSAGLVELPELPTEPFSVCGRFGVTDLGYEVEGAQLTLGNALVTLDGSIGNPPLFHETDLRIEADGPNASLVNALMGVSVPVAPFRLRGRVNRHASGLLFEEFMVQLGEYKAEVHGALGESPTLVGTDLHIRARGPGTALLHEFVDVPRLPDEPFQVEGHFQGRPEAFSMSGFSLRYGASDVRGSFRVDLTGPKPDVEAEFHSDSIDLRPFLPSVDTREEELPSASVAKQPVKAKRRLIPDKPVDLPILDRVDARVRWRADVLELPASQTDDLEIGLELRDGNLLVDPIAATGSIGGVLTGDISIRPGERGFAIRARLAVDHGRLRLSKTEKDPDRWPTLDLDININTFGRSVHELVSHANGWFGFVFGEGVVGNSIMDLLAADILVELLQALNPFAAENDDTYLNCAVIMLNLNDGVVTLDPIAVQTERMTIIGNGSVDLTTEEIKLDWITKPRKGFGLSASTLTNPYIRLGGTLAAPSIELKPIEAAISTGAAVATLGLSLAARGLWNRITAERKVCKKAIEQAEQHLKGE